MIFYSIVFLVVLLILNFRQDPFVLVATRMKKFQTEFLNEYVSKKDEIDLNSWQRKLDIRREEVKRSIKKGLNQHLSILLDPVKISMENWLEFLGYFLSEGSATRHKKSGYIAIKQKLGEKRENIKKLLDKLPFQVREY